AHERAPKRSGGAQLHKYSVDAIIGAAAEGGGTMIGFSIHEVMEGTIQRNGESFDRPFRIDVEAVFPSLLGIFRAVVGRIVGSVRIDGLGKRSPADGTLELSPFWKRLVRYTFDLQAD